MMSLWLGAGLLCVLAAVFIFWPLMGARRQAEAANVEQVEDRLAENVRLFHEHIAELQLQLAAGRIDQQQFDQLKLEQERALLADDADLRQIKQNAIVGVGLKTLAVITLALVAAALGLYASLGSSADVEIRQLQERKLKLDNEDYRAGRLPDPDRARELAKLIQARLVDKPEQVQYWFFLARLHMELNDFDKAVNAYQQLLARDSESPMIMAELAQATFLRDGNSISPIVSDLVARVLKADPNNTTALGLAGIEAFGKKDYLGAIKYWQKTVQLTGTGSAGGQSLQAGIERATGLYYASGGTKEELEALNVGRQLSVLVSLAEGVEAKPGQVVFVYARAWQGPKMPLAIARVSVSELPKLVLLNESMAMSPEMSLASAEKVEVIARVSQNANATAQAGDWQGSFGPVDMKSVPEEIRVEINQQLAQ
jgi:cytochrome c-type biogenesis protein CcmH